MDLSASSAESSHEIQSPGPARTRRPEIVSRTRSIPGTKPKARLVVEIQPRPKYVPGSGPALQPIRLLPSTTSTAYIIERILLPSPGLAADGKPQSKRMTYIVGWHDRPAASLLVPAMEILDYVSPGVLEDWEERLQDELDGERDKLAQERKAPSWTLTEPKKQKSRPPIHTEIEDVAAIEPVPEAQDDIHPKPAAMSLSTPSKRKLEDFENLSDDVEHEEESPSNQLAREMSGANNRGDYAGVYTKKKLADPDAVEPMESFTGIFGHVNIALLKHSKSHSVTPVPYPAYVASTIDHFASSTEQLKKQRANSLTRLSNADLRCSIKEGMSTPIELYRDNFSGSKPFATPLITRDSTGSIPRKSISAANRAQDPTKKPKVYNEAEKKRKPSPSSKVIDGEGQQDWEVERLEDFVVYDVEGRGLVRYFLVHWAGNWPADQQSSWEPEENIPTNMIRNFLKLGKETRAKRKLQAQKRKREAQTSAGAAAADTKKQAWWGFEKHYSSVSEAFEGNVEEGPNLGNSVGDDGGGVRYDDHDIGSEVFIVDEELEAMSSKTGITSTFAF